MNRAKIVSMLICLALFFLADLSTGSAAFKKVHVNEPTPEINLPTLDGTQVALDSFRNNPLTAVVFWGLWSPNSAPLLKDIQKLMDEFGDKGLSAIAVNIDGADKTSGNMEDEIRKFMMENSLSIPMLIDKRQDVYGDWGVLVSPTTAFLGKDLILLHEFSGYSKGSYADAREKIMELLGVEDEIADAEKPKRERFKAPKDVMRNYGMVKVQYERGQFSKAARKIEGILEESPEFPDAHALKGAIQLGLGANGKKDSGAEALASFQKAVELDETLPMGLLGLAHFEAEDGSIKEAIELTGKAVKYTNPDELPKLPSLEKADKTAETDNSVSAYLEKALRSLEAGQTEEASSTTKLLIRELLGLKNGPALKAKGLAVKEQRDGGF